MTELSPLQREVIAGLTAGTLTTITVHPLDLIKIRLQLLATSTHRYGYREIARSILKSSENSHLLKEVYRGLGINLFGNAIAWGVYFGLYREAKDLIYRWTIQDHHQEVLKIASERDSKMSSLMYLGAGASSGFLTAILTNPIWVIKTRIMSTSSYASGSYRSTWDGVKTLLKKEGIVAFWYGLLPSTLGVSQGAIYFMIYDTLKHRFSSVRYKEGQTNNDAPKLKTIETIVMTTLSKMISLTAVYPFQLLKSNLQSFRGATEHYTLRRLVDKIYQAEGIVGFYRGLSANLIRSVPSACITFSVYENFKHWL